MYYLLFVNSLIPNVKYKYHNSCSSQAFVIKKCLTTVFYETLRHKGILVSDCVLSMGCYDGTISSCVSALHFIYINTKCKSAILHYIIAHSKLYTANN